MQDDRRQSKVPSLRSPRIPRRTSRRQPSLFRPVQLAGTRSRQAFFAHEERFRRQGLEQVAGVDEAGRGPLAGPVVAAAVILPPRFDVREINDSKRLSAAIREQLFDYIVDNAAAGLGVVDPEEIDATNIVRATFRAMAEAVADLTVPPDALLIDGLHTIPRVAVPQQAIIHGDRESASIAAASIVAKVTRDRLMASLHECYPQYGFLTNKGYATRQHLEALRVHGPCPIHRRTFAPVRLWSQRDLPLEQ